MLGRCLVVSSVCVERLCVCCVGVRELIGVSGRLGKVEVGAMQLCAEVTPTRPPHPPLPHRCATSRNRSSSSRGS